MRLSIVSTLALSLGLLPISSAWAAPPEDTATDTAAATGEAPVADAEGPAEGSADALSAKAVEAFEGKDYPNAVKFFEEAYAVDPNPNYLFNIGRVHEEAGDLRSAVSRYEEFVKSPGVDLESRKFANERLGVLRGINSAEDEALADDERRKADAKAAEENRQRPVEGPAGPTDGGEDNDPRKRTRTVGFVLLGVGAAAVAGGGVAGGLALGKHNDFKDETDFAAASDLQSEGKRLNGAADGLFIAGGVIAATGLVMVLASLKKKDKKTARTQVTPALGRTGAGLSLSHRF